MKIRNGFVSNSSSSSFIIAISKPTSCVYCGRSDPDIISLIETESMKDNDTDVSYESPEEIIEYFQNSIDNENNILEQNKKKKDDELTSWGTKISNLRKSCKESITRSKLIINKIRKAIKQGKEVHKISLSYHGNLNGLLRSSNNIEILDEDN